jgi:hypothetical protein
MRRTVCYPPACSTPASAQVAHVAASSSAASTVEEGPSDEDEALVLPPELVTFQGNPNDRKAFSKVGCGLSPFHAILFMPSCK